MGNFLKCDFDKQAGKISLHTEHEATRLTGIRGVLKSSVQYKGSYIHDGTKSVCRFPRIVKMDSIDKNIKNALA